MNKNIDAHNPCRSRLAGDEAFGFCTHLEAAIAGKPGSYRVFDAVMVMKKNNN
ncbi:hypothetical protein HX792_08330 [Pseudomonas sp. B6002]|uniref:hypothetical protein n=1 Tax=Pseudomonas sp. B6002 TaxID=2726978 RepID=UPI0015A3B511|nr:hypothetical protein [Pseudomonas sp. B6002]NVZ50335.1 hypothetical protein [Pseudomonas sp. B6002]